MQILTTPLLTIPLLAIRPFAKPLLTKPLLTKPLLTKPLLTKMPMTKTLLTTPRHPSRSSARMITAALFAALTATPAAGDDTELFVTDTRRFPDARPNVLLILDTSASLAQAVETQQRYDSAVRYTGRCDASRVYWRTGVGAPPQCSTDRWFERAT